MLEQWLSTNNFYDIFWLGLGIQYPTVEFSHIPKLKIYVNELNKSLKTIQIRNYLPQNVRAMTSHKFF